MLKDRGWASTIYRHKIKIMDNKIYLITFSDGRPNQIAYGSKEEKEIRKNPGWNSRLGGFDSIEQMIEKLQIPKEPCKFCGEKYFSTDFGEIGDELKEKNICFTCNHWDSNNNMEGLQRIIVKGSKYSVGPELPPHQRFAGHGGRLFKIKFLDTGEVIETRNLWCQGEISKAWLEKMPDNAEFIN